MPIVHITLEQIKQQISSNLHLSFSEGGRFLEVACELTQKTATIAPHPAGWLFSSERGQALFVSINRLQSLLEPLWIPLE